MLIYGIFRSWRLNCDHIRTKQSWSIIESAAQSVYYNYNVKLVLKLIPKTKILSPKLVLKFINLVRLTVRSHLSDYENYLRQVIVQEEWRFQRKHSRLENYFHVHFIYFVFICFLTCVWESEAPLSLLWTFFFPMYVDWFTYLKITYLMPWKSPILLAILMITPFKIIVTDKLVWRFCILISN